MTSWSLVDWIKFFTPSRAKTCSAHLSKARCLWALDSKMLQKELPPSRPSSSKWIKGKSQSPLCHCYQGIKFGTPDVLMMWCFTAVDPELMYSNAGPTLIGSFRTFSDNWSLATGCSDQVCLEVGTRIVLELGRVRRAIFFLGAINVDMEKFEGDRWKVVPLGIQKGWSIWSSQYWWRFQSSITHEHLDDGPMYYLWFPRI